MNTKNIVVVGSANMDLVMRVKRFPKAGETLSGKNFMTAHGGKGANQAVAAARLGARVSFVGCVGEDAFGDFQRVGFAREGMDLSYLKIHPDLPTGTAIILVADSGENTIVVDPAANNGLSPEDIARLGACFSMADQVISQLEIPLETVEATLQLARSCGTFSLLDAGPARFLPEEMVAGADLISPNESEAEALTGIRVDSRDTAREAAQRLRDWGAAHVVMKLGSKGCLYLGDEELFVPAFTVDAVDTTGAGDAFTAALAVAWGQVSLPEALRFANAAGALAATVEGAQPSMPTLEAVLTFLDRNPAGK